MNDDLKDALRVEIQNQIDSLNEIKSGSEEEERIYKNVCQLTDRIEKLDSLDAEISDREERREADAKRAKAQLELEREKSKLDWKRAAFEMAKVLVPGFIGGAFYLKAQERVLKFEETGRIVSSAGRDLRLPNLFTFWKK